MGDDPGLFGAVGRCQRTRHNLELWLDLRGSATTHRFSTGTWTATTRQSLGDLLRSLMDLDWPMPEAFLEAQRQRVEENRSPRFFDITTWSLPLAANLDAWIVDAPVDSQIGGLRAFEPIVGDGDVGFLVPPSAIAGYRLVARQRPEQRQHPRR